MPLCRASRNGYRRNQTEQQQEWSSHIHLCGRGWASCAVPTATRAPEQTGPDGPLSLQTGRASEADDRRGDLTQRCFVARDAAGRERRRRCEKPLFDAPRARRPACGAGASTAREIVITGSALRTRFPEAGDEVTYRIEGLGETSMSVVG